MKTENNFGERVRSFECCKPIAITVAVVFWKSKTNICTIFSTILYIIRVIISLRKRCTHMLIDLCKYTKSHSHTFLNVPLFCFDVSHTECNILLQRYYYLAQVPWIQNWQVFFNKTQLMCVIQRKSKQKSWKQFEFN